MSYVVPFVAIQKQYQQLREEISELLDDVLFKRADFILRKDLKEFEKNFASFLGVKFAIGLNSGTDALHLALHAAGVGPGDEVITVAHTFVATVEVIVHCGATPVLIDVGEDYNMDVTKIEEAISPKTKAIIPVHLNGRMCNMERIMDIANKNNLIVIEDAAQAIGASFDGKKAGTFGLIGCFSLYPMKILGGIGDGGVLVTNDEAIAKKVRLLRDHGQDRETGDILLFGFNSRLDNVNAAILNLKLKFLPDWIKRRREIASLYHQGLSHVPEIKLPPPPQENDCYFDVYQNYVIRTKDRDVLVKYLNKSGIEVLISWPKPMHHHMALNLNQFHLPVTEQISKEVISLPLNTEITNEQVEYVIETIRKFYQK